MGNLRIVSVEVSSSTKIIAKFSDNLNDAIDIANILLTSQLSNIEDPNILKTTINENKLNIEVSYLTPQVPYTIKFINSVETTFSSEDGSNVLPNDDNANIFLIYGPIENSNIFKPILINYLRDNIYDLNPGTFVSNYVDFLSTFLSTSLTDIKQSKNENYLSFTVTDEKKVRGDGPFDRLDQEGAYEIIRAGIIPSDSSADYSIDVEAFPSFRVSLLQTDNTETVILGSNDAVGVFNINNLTLTLTKKFITKLTSLVVTYSNLHAPYTYDIETLGYHLKNAKYDQDFAFAFVSLEDNQIKLSDVLLQDPNFSSSSILSIEVSYQYKDYGRSVNTDTVIVSTILQAVREELPPISNIFSLKHASLTNQNGIDGSVGDVFFNNPNSLPELNDPHPAFLYEIPFRMEYLPSKIGEYAIDYSTGTVYVFGEDSNNFGTGAYPPSITYYYKFIFVEDIDYVFDRDFLDIVALPAGNLLDEDGTITFSYDQVLAKDIDYKAAVHTEVLNERINNKLFSLSALQIENAPITDVFRIFNETTGEVYNPIRWNHDKVYFSFIKAPNITESVGERANFNNLSSDLLIVSQELNSTNLLSKIFKVKLRYDEIIAGTEDCIGSSINSSVSFSDTDLFKYELYYNNFDNEADNLLRLAVDGYYLVNYREGIVYCHVPLAQDLEIGSISYRYNDIITNHKHITSVEDIYYKINIVGSKDKTFEYLEFDDDSIVVDNLDYADEKALDNNSIYPYVLLSKNVGTIINATFTPGITNSIKYMRGVYELNDLLNNATPLNFVSSTSFTSKFVSIDNLSFTETHVVQYDGYNYYVDLDTNLNYLSPNISIGVSVINSISLNEIWNGSGTIIIGSPIRLILPPGAIVATNDNVIVNYYFTISDLSSIILDYNKGDLFIDYTYLADEILVSYEYGDNVLDFRNSTSLDPGDEYFVSYKVGALRDGLLNNFGTTIDIPILNNFDTLLDRERYRDALSAAYHSFFEGSTVSSIKELVSTISHAPTDIVESVFSGWSLGSSLLVPEDVQTTGNLEITSVRYGDGVLINDPSQTITFPVANNLRVEEGSLEFWLKPEWDGVDNQSVLQIEVKRNNITLNHNSIFVGAGEYHPEYETVNGKSVVVVSKEDIIFGRPNMNKNGVYIYMDQDSSTVFNRWFVEVVDGYGSVSGQYNINITTIGGYFYDTKSSVIPKPSDTQITSSTKTIKLVIQSSTNARGVTFVADAKNYLVDFGEETKNRFSLFKDETGYLNFKVIDIQGTVHYVASDISSWRSGDLHHIAISWRLNSRLRRDELHLFIDGFEVPNIIDYGNRFGPYLHEKFRTVNPEEIVGAITADIVGSTDLITTAGSDLVSSSINFSDYDISIGDLIFIEETGFDTSGYTISNINGNELSLNGTPMPLTLTNANFSVNKTGFQVNTNINAYDRIAVFTLHSFLDGYDLVTTDGYETVSSAMINFEDEGIVPGNLIRIDGYQFENHYVILEVSGNILTLNDDMPISSSGLVFNIYTDDEEEIPGVRALHPSYEISQDELFNNVLTIRNDVNTDDIILIKTFGLNHRRIRQKYYSWSNYANIIMTQLPPPISLDEVKVYHILLNDTNIGPDNSTLTLGRFFSDNLAVEQPSISIAGRFLAATIRGNNIDFSDTVEVIITGTTIDTSTLTPIATVETLTFTEAGTQFSTNRFVSIDYINVNCTPIDDTKNCLVVELEEKSSIIVDDGSNLTSFDDGYAVSPVIRFSYQVNVGSTLECDGYSNIVSDFNAFFSSTVLNNYLVIHSPASVAGFYKIVGVSEDHHSLTLEAITAAFPLPLTQFFYGNYEVLNTTTYRSGLQNGFFIFEQLHMPGTPYLLKQGLYRFDYLTYLNIPLAVGNHTVFLGSDINGEHQANAAFDEFRVLSEEVFDTRIGETISAGGKSFTKDFNSLKELKKDSSTLLLFHMDEIPIENSADFYVASDSKLVYSGNVVNDNFGKSVIVIDNPIRMDNLGILNTKTEGTIEFWVNTLFDTANDPNDRYYFDATSIVSEETVSVDSGTVKIIGKAQNIVSVKLQAGNKSIDYFLAGELENDNQTIRLNKVLPDHNTPVIVVYSPLGTNGDRLSIFKDRHGYLNFSIIASNIDYSVRTPIFWARNTWHKVKASYQINRVDSELRLFVDGYERGNVLFGEDVLFGDNLTSGSTFLSTNRMTATIVFSDIVNEIYIGSDSSGKNGAYALLDNFKISNVSKPVFAPFGEPIDVSYSSNNNIVLPAIHDLYTTLLLDFELFNSITDDFSILKNNTVGIFDFLIKASDSFDIIKDSDKVKEILETLVRQLKPANSRAFIRYI